MTKNNLFILGFKRLEMYGIPVPRFALVNREVPYQELDYFIEEEDYVEVHGNRFWKPFVEKPVEGKFGSYLVASVCFSPISENKCNMVPYVIFLFP